MNILRYYAFYGTLRRGMENHQPYAAHLKYIRSVSLSGYEMYSLVEYPYAIRTNNSGVIVAELFEVMDPHTEQLICEMELESDYNLSTVEIDSTIFGIFLFDKAAATDNRIVHGDWCRHCQDAAF